MAQMSRRFNFDDFQEQIDDALAENEQAMREFVMPKVTEIRRPGEIGSVVTRLSFELPPDDAA